MDKIAVRLLGIVEDGCAALAVDQEKPGRVIEKRKPELSGEPIPVDFVLRGGVAPAIAWLEEINVGFPEETIVDGKTEIVVASGADGRVVAWGMVGATMKPRARVVDDAAGAINEGHILRVVAHLLFGNPTADIGLADPEMIRRQGSRTCVVAPAHDAFTPRGIVGEGAAGGRSEIVHRLQIKSRRGFAGGGQDG